MFKVNNKDNKTKPGVGNQQETKTLEYHQTKLFVFNKLTKNFDIKESFADILQNSCT